MKETFEGQIFQIGNQDNPSFAITIPKLLIKQGKVQENTTYKITISDEVTESG